MPPPGFNDRVWDMPVRVTHWVLAATALAMPDDRERCLAVGCNDYLARPFSFKMLSDRIAALMQTTTLP